MDNADKLARGIVGPEIRKHLFITQNLTGPLVSPGLSYEANNIIAQAIRDAEKRGRIAGMEEAAAIADDVEHWTSCGMAIRRAAELEAGD